MQLNLFDNPPKPKLARRIDPETSQAAAAHIEQKLPRIQAAVMEAVQDMNGANTANEIAEWVQSTSSVEANTESIRKRVGELKRKGLLVECGRRECRETSKQAETFTTPKTEKDAECWF